MHGFERIAEEQGWTESTQVAVLLEYIENQLSDGCFHDFLLEKQEQPSTFEPE